ncbi:hypothetical protein CBR_g55216 [Chara braunii]|uniref:Uncharacterized protein n=1 Tax=Chara braunii TaxID=69332 RepID=A0A388MCP3_CHABU|nr:hypothetical protein CBR_g55216 [Chara braunii]|eukprot:GBG92336.1 hypothetical protein CBR_g55216 [Chara braunii]
MSILDDEKWEEWWGAYVELGFCLLEVVFHWAELAPNAEGGEIQDNKVELLIAQPWRMDIEGEWLGILFGKVEEGHVGPITDELLVFLVQLVDDLPLDILSRCDEEPGTDVLTRTLAPHLLWSTCTELDEDNYLYPSQSLYLEIDVTDLTLWDPFVRGGNPQGASDEEEEEEEEEEAEEEESGTDPDDPDYIGSKEDKEETGLREFLVTNNAVKAGEAIASAREGREIIGIEGSESPEKCRAEMIAIFACGDGPRYYAVNLDHVVASPHGTKEQDMEAEGWDSASNGGVGMHHYSEASRVEVAEGVAGKQIGGERDGGSELAEGEVVKGTAKE